MDYSAEVDEMIRLFPRGVTRFHVGGEEMRRDAGQAFVHGSIARDSTNRAAFEPIETPRVLGYGQHKGVHVCPVLKHKTIINVNEFLNLAKNCRVSIRRGQNGIPVIGLGVGPW